MNAFDSWLEEAIVSLSAERLLRQQRVVESDAHGNLRIDGQTVWDFASNDYLGLATDARVIEAATEAMRQYGVGSTASALICGRTELHAKLERKLAEFEGTDAAILFPTGMAANVGTVASLAGPGDVVFCDRFNHASLVDGCKLSGARLRVYRHTDLDGLRKSLIRESPDRSFIVTDSIFSMDGDLAPLVELSEIADEYRAILIVDEAHGTGVFGERGRGVAELLDVEQRISVRIGTLSKAVGTLGGFVTGQKRLIDYLWNTSRTQIYSTALPPSICAAATVALEIISNEPQRRQSLHATCETFREQLGSFGVEPLAGSVGPIVPILLDNPDTACAMADDLLKQGFLVGAIRPPTVPRGTSRLRITLHYGMPPEVVAKLAATIGQLYAAR
jgi:8-amino-7-oxononanoate synthase